MTVLKVRVREERSPSASVAYVRRVAPVVPRPRVAYADLRMRQLIRMGGPVDVVLPEGEVVGMRYVAATRTILTEPDSPLGFRSVTRLEDLRDLVERFLCRKRRAARKEARRG